MADKDSARRAAERSAELHRWVRQLRKDIPIDDVIDRVRTRLRRVDAEDRGTLELELGSLFIEAGRYDDQLRLIDDRIEREKGSVRSLIAKASHYHLLEEREQALRWIDVALERAFHTRFFRREALGDKARLLLELGHGEELGNVLEQIMSLDMYAGVPDIGKERDFVDNAPPGLIREDIVVRYDRFCPKHDPLLELHRWASDVRRDFPVEEAVDRVRSRLQRASAADRPTLTYILGIFLIDAQRHDEAVPLLDSVIAQQPDHVRAAIAKASVLLDRQSKPDEALEVIELALERAFRTRFYRRQALGEKARILLTLGRGDELGQVLEQIMSLQIFSDVRDTARARDFVDDAPPGLIAADIVARYDAFCPKLGEN